MHRNRQRLALIAAGVAVALTLTGAAMAAFRSHSAAAGTTVKVTETEYHIALSPKSLPAGTIKLSVHNAGKIGHQLDVSGAGLTKIAHLGTIAPGATRTLTVKLTGGTASLWCPLPGHAKLGMKASLIVKGSTPAPAGGATTTSGGGSAWG